MCPATICTLCRYLFRLQVCFLISYQTQARSFSDQFSGCTDAWIGLVPFDSRQEIRKFVLSNVIAAPCPTDHCLDFLIGRADFIIYIVNARFVQTRDGFGRIRKLLGEGFVGFIDLLNKWWVQKSVWELDVESNIVHGNSNCNCTFLWRSMFSFASSLKTVFVNASACFHCRPISLLIPPNESDPPYLCSLASSMRMESALRIVIT